MLLGPPMQETASVAAVRVGWRARCGLRCRRESEAPRRGARGCRTGCWRSMRWRLILALSLAGCSKPKPSLLPWQTEKSALPKAEQRVFEQLLHGEKNDLQWKTL